MPSISAFSVAYTAGAVVLLFLAGLPPRFARATTPATAAEAAAHAVRWLTLFVTLVFVVPMHEKLFKDFGVKIPFLTGLVIRASDMATLWMPGLLLIAAALTVAFHRLHRDPAKRPQALRISRLATAATIASVLAVLAPLCLPLIRIGTDLS